MSRLEALKAQSRHKYAEKWRDKSYHERSPAVDAKEDILPAINSFFKRDIPRRGEWGGGFECGSVLDVGAGTGRIAPFLKEAGHRVGLHDCVANCFDKEAVKSADDLIICDITELPENAYDVVLCSDVMEHIPPELAGGAIRAVARCCRKGAVFGISNLPVDLHVNLQDAEGWMNDLYGAFNVVEKLPGRVYHPRQTPDNWFLFRCEKGGE